MNTKSTSGEEAAAREGADLHRRWGRIGLLLVLSSLVAGVWSGCAAFQSGGNGEEPRSSVLNPRWDEGALDEHLRFFRETLLEKPAEPARTAAYLTARMKAAWLQPALEGRYRLQKAPAEALGFVGYVAGKNPEYAQEVVIVCADLTAGASPVEAAALLEVARAYGTFAQYEPVPERSVLFALWFRPDSARSAAPTADPAAGLRTYLRQPTWALEKTRSVLYVGLPLTRRSAVDALLREYNLPLRRITAPPVPAPARTEAPGEAPPDTAAAVDEDAVRQAEIRRALALAQRTHERLRAETITFGKMMPALGDTLRIPHEQE